MNGSDVNTLAGEVVQAFAAWPETFVSVQTMSENDYLDWLTSEFDVTRAQAPELAAAILDLLP